MSERKVDPLDDAIARALGPDAVAVRAPDGFASRVDQRLYFTALLERRRRVLRVAAMLGAGSALLFLGVLTLFVQAVDVPGWVVENVPGVLGRLDAVRVELARSPGVLLAFAGGVVLTAAGVATAALRPRRN
jgi:hypothetical protein